MIYFQGSSVAATAVDVDVGFDAQKRNLQGVLEVELESYFEFLSDDAISIAGTRIGIERVVQDYQEAAYQQSHQHPSALIRSLRERVARLRQERRPETPVASAKS